MARKKTTDKAIGSRDVHITMLEKQIKNMPVCRNTMQHYVNWGRRNTWIYDILSLVAESPTLSSCINFAVTSLVGDGIDYAAMNVDGSSLQPNYRYSWNEFIRRCARDYFISGSFAFQIVKNRDGVSYSYFHQPIETVRCSPRDEDGLITSYWLSDDWSAVGKNPPIEVPSLIMRPDEEWNLDSGKVYLFVYESYQPTTNGYYSVPCWQSAIKSVQAETEIMKYELRQTSSSFVPAGVLQLPPVDTEEQKQAILSEIDKMFVGSENANALMTVFANASDDTPAKFTPFVASEKNTNLYADTSRRVRDRILASFGIPSAQLVGLPESNSTGFNSEADLLRTAYQMYETLAGNHARQSVIGVINECFRANGIDTELIMKPLSFLNDDTTEKDTGTEAPEIDDKDNKESNITEQKTN